MVPVSRFAAEATHFCGLAWQTQPGHGSCIRSIVTLSWHRWLIALATAVAWVCVAQHASAQLAARPVPPPPPITVDFNDLRNFNVSPLALSVWNYISSESRVSETRGWGLSVSPHFGAANITYVERLSVWGLAGSAIGLLAASAPSFQSFQIPKENVWALGWGALGGVVAGHVLWQWTRPDPDYKGPKNAFSMELTATSVRIEHLRTPISLPTVTYAWVPSIVGRW